jgi:hypothetical protein
MNPQDDNPKTNDHANAKLDADFQHLRHVMRDFNAPDALETRLQKQFAKRHRATSGWTQHIGQWLAPGTAVTACVGIAMWMAATTFLVPGSIAINGQNNTMNPANDRPFVALQSLEQIALEPNPRVIETQIPKMMLTTMGVAVPPDVAGEMLRTEMLVSASGQPLALRFTSN